MEIKKGMIIAIEPAIYTKQFGIRIEHDYLITKKDLKNYNKKNGERMNLVEAREKILTSIKNQHMCIIIGEFEVKYILEELLPLYQWEKE